MYVKPKWKFQSFFPSILFIIPGTVVFIFEEWCRKLQTLTYQGMDLLIRFCSRSFSCWKYNCSRKPKDMANCIRSSCRLLPESSCFKNIYGKCHWFIRTNYTKFCTSHFFLVFSFSWCTSERNHFKAYFRCLFFMEQHCFICGEASQGIISRRYIARLSQQRKFHP